MQRINPSSVRRNGSPLVWPNPLERGLALDAELGGVVEDAGVSVEIPPDSLVDEQGERVCGRVDVVITRCDPDEPAAPGVYLLRFATSQLSLSRAGRPVRLAPGAFAQIEIDRPVCACAKRGPRPRYRFTSRA